MSEIIFFYLYAIIDAFLIGYLVHQKRYGWAAGLFYLKLVLLAAKFLGLAGYWK